jgi:hypothetical protein
MKRRSNIWLVLAVMLSVVCGLSSEVYAAVPHLISYQGKLTNPDGVALEGAYDLTFRIYDAETAGNLLWQETQAGVVVTKGLFSVNLGSVTALGLAFDKQYFLEIKVGTEVMTPRQRITSAGYAIRSETAENALTVGGYAVSATPAANKLLPLSSAGKLLSGALRIYDSGWFQIASAGRYTLTHNLGLSDPSRAVTTVYIAQDNLGTNARAASPAAGFVASTSYGVNLRGFGANQVVVQIGNSGVASLDDNGTLFGAVGTDFDYCRVVILALE